MSSSSAAAAASNTTKPQRRRLLFLHGQAVPPEYYKNSLAKELLNQLDKANYEVEFVQSPRHLTANIPGLDKLFPDLQQDQMREWFNAHSNNDEDGSKRYEGLQESLDFLQDYLQKQPTRFDVIAGHSNGALMAAILSFYIQTVPDWLPDKSKYHWSTLLLCNAPAAFEKEQTLAKMMNEHHSGGVIGLPSVHVWGGPTDHTYQGQQALQKIHFPDGVVVEHSAGHFFPSDPETNQKIVEALSQTLKE